jgi:hypothetical protein
MKIKLFLDFWRKAVDKFNGQGVPLPTIRDPQTGRGSVSLTFVFISFNLVVVGVVGKWSGALGGIDIAQALNLFYACAALYWGRKFQNSGVDLGESSEIDKSK